MNGRWKFRRHTGFQHVKYWYLTVVRIEKWQVHVLLYLGKCNMCIYHLPCKSVMCPKIDFNARSWYKIVVIIARNRDVETIKLYQFGSGMS